MEIPITKSATIGQRPRPKSEAELGFGKYFTDHMFLMDYEKGKGWINPRIVPDGPLSLDPSAMVFHYGQEIFEGLKAYRWPDGTIALFRPDMNIDRWNRSARRLCMAETDPEIFMQGMKTLILLDRDWIPSSKGTSLYIRPTMIATEAALGVKPSSRYLFFIILGPVGPDYPEGFSPTKIYVTNSYARAAQGGLGETRRPGRTMPQVFLLPPWPRNWVIPRYSGWTPPSTNTWKKWGRAISFS